MIHVSEERTKLLHCSIIYVDDIIWTVECEQQIIEVKRMLGTVRFTRQTFIGATTKMYKINSLYNIREF